MFTSLVSIELHIISLIDEIQGTKLTSPTLCLCHRVRVCVRVCHCAMSHDGVLMVLVLWVMAWCARHYSV